MKQFMDENFLLSNKVAQQLYHEHAATQPIFDYHCHLIPSEIAANKRFSTITDAWLGGDHYKWRQMRSNGVPENLVTGKDADPYEKFVAWAGTMEQLVGNPLYHWTHLELRRYFNIDLILNRANAREIYDLANKKFAEDPQLSVFGIMDKFNVYAVGTTDDPADDLAYHAQIAKEGKCPAKVLPSYRPDKALNIEKADFAQYIKQLGTSAGMAINSVDDVVKALVKRLDFFVSLGCKASDHALSYPPFVKMSDEQIQSAFAKKMEGGELTAAEVDAYKTKVLIALAAAYHERNIAMQLHFAALRDNNTRMFKLLGPDTGFDASFDLPIAQNLSSLLNAMSENDQFPKTILYTLNPKDYYSLGTLMGCYQGGGIPGKVQLGSAWWFCDHKDGMEQQMKDLGNLGLLGRFIGMLTDSRSFLSYPRHEYFRRILCNILGTWVEDGEVPYDMGMLGSMVENISFGNAQRYFEG